MFGREHLECQEELARYIEFYLKKRIWMAENVPDDHVVWPAVPISASYTDQHQDWGVELAWQGTDDELGSESIIAPFANKVDLSLLRAPRTEVDDGATSALMGEAADLVAQRLDIYPMYQSLGESPFEFAVRLRGLERIFLDVHDQPELVHEMMEIITRSIIADHELCEARGWLNCPPDRSGRYQMVPTYRHIAAYLSAGFDSRSPLVSDEWAYVSAQSAFGLGPGMYEEFVHRYNCCIAELFTGKTVYYHGCECLDQKLGVISTLPNLRRHHVSAWSSLPLAVQAYQGSVVLEVTTHPNLVALDLSREEMKRVMVRLVQEADGHPMNLSITDIYNLGGNPDSLRLWAEAAQEAVS
jgi:hypothetical protein